jgi:hypothetical protein
VTRATQRQLVQTAAHPHSMKAAAAQRDVSPGRTRDGDCGEKVILSMSAHIRRSLLALAAVALAGCSSPLAPADLAGEYVLVSVNGLALSNGPGVVAGTVRLQASGLVERTIVAVAPDGARIEQRLDGTFIVKGSVVRLALRDDTYTWRPPARIDGRVLTVTYPSPADGPDVVERYERE